MRFLFAAALASFFVIAGCGEDELEVNVDLRTDFAPLREFESIRTVYAGSPFSADDEPGNSISLFHTVRQDEDYAAGVGVAEFGNLAAGTIHVRVQLLDKSNAVVMTRDTQVQLVDSFGLTVVMTRDCRGISCPLSSSADNETQCLGGRCVDPSCYVQNQSACGESECSNNSDCRARTACTTASCVGGACLETPDDTACSSGEYCDPANGCMSSTPRPDMGRPDLGPPDLGPPDLGPPDLGVADSGPEDAGPPDLGPPDLGPPDLGPPDLGPDLGPGCPPTETSCMDGRDEDCDGMTDCADSDCVSEACNDGVACTHTDVCTAGGQCAGTPLTCTSSACTTRSCDGSPTCRVTQNTGATCDDTNPCTHTDQCNGSGTCAGTTVTCTSSTCITRTCNGTATCDEMINNGRACDDMTQCTHTDRCSATGVCRGTAITCTTDTCMTRACNGTSSCTQTPRTGNCAADTNPCTRDVCSGGVCTHPAGNNGAACASDGNACTSDVCSGGGCSHPASPNGTQCGGTWDRCCGGSCKNTATDWDHCGGCNNSCNAVTFATRPAFPSFTSSCVNNTMGGYTCSCYSSAGCDAINGAADGWVCTAANGYCRCTGNGDCQPGQTCVNAGARGYCSY